MCPLYVEGLIGLGERKSIQPMAERLAGCGYDRLHHFIADGVWDHDPLTRELLIQADRLVGGSDAVLVIDDTALPKKGDHSVGVAAQYASALGKTANCQTLVSLTLASGEVPIMAGLRLFLPENWTGDHSRLAQAGVPQDCWDYRTKPEIALAEIDRLRCQRRCKIRPRGGAKVDHLAHGERCRQEGQRPVSRAHKRQGLTGRCGPPGPIGEGAGYSACGDFRARLWVSR